MALVGVVILIVLASFILSVIVFLLELVAVIIGIVLVLGGVAMVLYGRKWWGGERWERGPPPAST
jgi:hypothetical protein